MFLHFGFLCISSNSSHMCGQLIRSYVAFRLSSTPPLEFNRLIRTGANDKQTATTACAHHAVALNDLLFPRMKFEFGWCSYLWRIPNGNWQLYSVILDDLLALDRRMKLSTSNERLECITQLFGSPSIPVEQQVFIRSVLFEWLLLRQRLLNSHDFTPNSSYEQFLWIWNYCAVASKEFAIAARHGRKHQTTKCTATFLLLTRTHPQLCAVHSWLIVQSVRA